jgi:hypothetical protein
LSFHGGVGDVSHFEAAAGNGISAKYEATKAGDVEAGDVEAVTGHVMSAIGGVADQ